MIRMIAAFFKLLVWPFRLVLRLLGNVLTALFRPLMRKIDSSVWLSDAINHLSSSMATQRGLLLMIGTALLVVSLVAHAVILMIMVSTDGFDTNLYLLCIPFTLFHVGVLAGFTGAMLATPLGQGYKDNK